MSSFGPGPIAAASVVLGAATGLITNIVTDQWSWTLGTALAVLVLAAAGFAWWSSRISATPRTRVSQTAVGGGRITDSRINARGTATAEQAARDGGTINASSISAHTADASQTTADGDIAGGHIIAEP